MKILIVQTAFLGDAVLSSPVVSAIASLFPGAARWLMVTPLAAQLYRGDSRLTGILAFDKRGRSSGLLGLWSQIKLLREHEFDVVYSLHRSFRTSFMLWAAGIPRRIGFRDAAGAWFYNERRPPLKGHHAVERHFALIAQDEARGVPLPPLDLPLPSIAHVSPVVKEIVEGRPFTALFPGSAWATKQWWSGHYRTLILSLEARGERCVVLGSAAERLLCEEVAKGTGAMNLAGSCAIPETVLLVQRARRVVCNDSMALHLASTFKTPSVAVFCATSPEFGFGPWQNPRSKVVEKQGLACRPCGRHGGPVCPTGTNACMREVTPSQVLSACDEIGAV